MTLTCPRPKCPNTVRTPISTATAWCNRHVGNSVPMRKVTS